MRPGQDFQNSENRTCKIETRKKKFFKSCNIDILILYFPVSVRLSCGGFYIKPETILKIKATKPRGLIKYL